MYDKVVCPYYSVGYCKFRNQCLKKHPKDDCNVKTCKRFNCFKKHKSQCKYGSNCKRHIKNRSCEFKHITEEPLNNNKELKELTRELKEKKDLILQLKLEISELQAMNTEKVKQLKTFTTENSSSTIFVAKEDCTNCKETNLIKSDLDQLA